MAAARVPVDGIYVPSPTFFKPLDKTAADLHPAIDVETQVKHSVHLARSGITGLVLMGSTGEAIHLTRQERFDLIAGVRKGMDEAGFPDYPIMAGTLINSTQEVLEWLEDAHKAGAQWGMVLAPGYFGVAASQENLVQWFTLVADQSPIPILIYNYPGVTNGVVINPDTYAILAAHPNIVGCKMSHGNVSHHLQVSLHPDIDASQFRVYSGFGQQLGPIVLFNAAGAIDGLGAIFPKTVSHLHKLVSERPAREETLEQARKLQWLVSSAEEYIGKTGVLGIREAIFQVLGMGHQEGGRLPLRGTIAPGEWEKWSGIMGRMIEAEKAL
ncbi:dihydrodipicolinate synthase [Stachybotrys elegans]|uniref:Dihydrodipicolinate synthase n=1 Tax=Stachybotrys elegans TaxID=80388 RepID=A0A8K0SDX9_9HYPO|nr:dihydrodipicolinate synthase [Stachybotrys elegans]